MEPETVDADSGPAPQTAAIQLSRSMPFVHYAASWVLQESETWPRWELSSRRWRGVGREGSGPLAQLCDDYVFFFAGPCCYAGCHPPPRERGDVAFYFPARCQAEADNEGDASPFDSGSLGTEERRGVLEPVCNLGPAERLEFLQRWSVPLANWRQTFSEWLSCCFQDPWRYIETTSNRGTDGRPDRTDPAEICESNGLTMPRPCADRRAWTWELRMARPVPLRQACLMHVAGYAYEVALRMRSKLDQIPGQRADFEVVPLSFAAQGPEAFYEESGQVLRTLLDRAVARESTA